MKVGVLYGGISGEREVSINSGKCIMEALRKKGHEVIGFDFNPNHLEELFALKEVDVVYIGLHGKFGEDGRVQSLLDMLNIKYVGSGVLASALAMDKRKAKRFFKLAGIRVAEDCLLTKRQFHHLSFKRPFDFPIVVKPNREGSTIGLTIAKTDAELLSGIEEAFKHDDEILLEQYIKGRESTVSVMGDAGEEQSLPVIEIVPKNAYYDYESKYQPGMSEHIVPAAFDEKTTALLQKHAVLAHQSLGCEVYSRADFIVPDDGTQPVILEVNTLPGMTPTSLFPDAARAVGLSYEDMIDIFIQLSLKKYE